MSEFTVKGVFLKNFKKHSSLGVEFSEAVSVIRGPNYAGKSSIIEAVFYALFGATAVPGGKAIVANRFAKAQPSVTLEFDANGKNGSILRTPTAANLWIEGELKATGHTAVNAWVEEYFGMAQKLILMLSRSSQGETSALMTLGAPELNRVIESVSNVKYVDDLADKASKLAAKAQAQVEAIGTVEDTAPLEEMLFNLQAESTELTAKLKKIEAEGKEMSGKAVELSAQIKEANVNNLKHRTLEAAIQLTRDSLLKLKTKIESAQATLASMTIPDVSSLLVKEGELSKDYLAKQGEYDSVVHTINRIPQLKAEIASVEKEKDKLPNIARLKTAEEVLSTLTKESNDAFYAVDACKKRIAAMRKEIANSVCSSCNRAFDESHLAEAKVSLVALEGQLPPLETTFTLAKNKYDSAKVEVIRLSSLQPSKDWEEVLEAKKERLAEYHTTIAGRDPEVLKGERDEINAQLVALKAEIRSGSEAKRNYDSLSMAMGVDEAAYSKHAENLKKSLAEQVVLIDVEPLNLELNALHDKIGINISLSSAASTMLSQCNRDISELSFRVSNSKEKSEKLKIASNRAVRFTSFNKWLKKNKAAFLADIWASLLSICTEFTAICTDGEVSQVLRDDAGDFSYIEGGEVFPMEAASGGQRSIMGVGLRLALASLLPQGCKLVTLDEPTSDLTSEKAAMMTAALSGQGRQVIMTTHRDGDEIVADHVIQLG